jgi:hypothetical protein
MAEEPLAKLPAELKNMVNGHVDFPYDKSEADRLREELMQERSVSSKEFDNQLTNICYSFCEH